MVKTRCFGHFVVSGRRPIRLQNTAVKCALSPFLGWFLAVGFAHYYYVVVIVLNTVVGVCSNQTPSTT